MDDVGMPKMLCVGHDGKGTRTDWLVDKVMLYVYQTAMTSEARSPTVFMIIIFRYSSKKLYSK